jgi:hypothetical protein
MSPSPRWRPTLVAGLLLLGLARPAVEAERSRTAPPLPTDPSRWVGPPTSWEALRGRVTLLFVWTFG